MAHQLCHFLCSHLPKAGVRHIGFCRDVTSICAYMHTFPNQNLNVTVYVQVYMQVYLRIYIHIYVQVAHNFNTFYATKLKFSDIYPDQDLRLHGRVAPGWDQIES